MTSDAVAGLAEVDLVALGVRRREHVAEVTLLGPGKGNALGPDFWRELPIVFRAMDADPRVRAVVLTGSAGTFSYGLDLPAMMPRWSEVLGGGALAGSRTRLLNEVRTLQAAVDTVAVCRKPVVAAVSGWCLGAGLDVAAAADIRLASADAGFGLREVRVAIVADLGSLQRLAGVVGEGHLRELAFTGRDIDAIRAQRIGLVNDVYPDADATLDAARGLATEIAQNSPLAVQGTKDVLGSAREAQVSRGLRYVSAWNAAFLPSHDLAEATQAFLERRPGRFTGE